MNGRILTALAASLLVLVAAPAAGAATVDLKTLHSGSRLVVVEQPSTETVSVRIVVGVGAASDPDASKGLAHYLEHVLFHGSHRTDGETFWHLVEAEGGVINAYTSPDATVYQLDISAEAADALVPMFIELIENPALSLADFDAEQGVVDAEAYLDSGRRTHWKLDQMLFPFENRGRALIGTRKSRRTIDRQVLTTFFRDYYHADNVTYVVTGPWSLARTTEVVSDASCLPSDEEGKKARRFDKPTLPAEAKINAAFARAILGYQVDATDIGSCDLLADALETRLRERLVVEEPAAANVGVGCLEVRGTLFLLATGHGAMQESSNLQDAMRELLFAIAKDGLTRRDVAVLTKRQKLRSVWLAEPPTLADHLATIASSRINRSDQRMLGALTPEKADAAALAALAAKSIRPEREVALLLSPFVE